VSRRPRSSALPLSPDPAEVAVFASGVSSMGFEILAGRLVAPVFGSSVFTWGAIIGVFLTALSVGYAVGARTATRRASRNVIVACLATSAVFVGLLSVGADPVLAFSADLPVPTRYATLLPVTILYGPLTFLLGLVSPYAAQLSAAESHGGASGRVYALGTIGSIVGAFGTTFVLVPALSLGLSELLLGGLLVVAALYVIRPTPAAVSQVTLAIVVLVGAALVGIAGPPAHSETVYETDTAYSHLRVVDHEGVRTLYLDGVRQSATYTDDREGYVFGYASYAHLPMLLQDPEEVDRVLVIGGGGFSIPKRYVEEYDVTVDVVELDPEVVRVARRYFGVRESRDLRIHTTDGRQFLAETDHTYDVIIMDAFRADRVPFHLTTREFMRLTADRLDEDGVLMANLIAARRGAGSAFYRAQVKTMQTEYGAVGVFPTADTDALQNIEVVATKTTPMSESGLVRRAQRRDIGIELTDEARQYQSGSSVKTEDVPVLTDDYAPVDALLDEQVGKRYVIVENNTTISGRATETPTPTPG
jgi:spermidine synthase